MPNRLLQNFSFPDIAMTIAVTAGTAAMMMAGGFSWKSNRKQDEVPTEPLEDDRARERLIEHYQSKWGPGGQ